MITATSFKEEVRLWARELAVSPKEIHVREMKKKLASCSTRGRLTFDISLLKAPKKKRDEVVAHELLHLKYPNHGKMFKAVLYAHLGRSYS